MATLLRDICGVDVSGVPVWVENAKAPGQERVDTELAEIESQIAVLERARRDRVVEREAVRDRLGLLYQTGKALEEQLWATLEALSAKVERPEDPGREDGAFAVTIDGKTHWAVAEITGMAMGKRSFKEAKLRQTKAWVDRARSYKSHPYKGVFILNAAPDLPPGERPNTFAPNQEEFARENQIAALTTVDLYVAHRLFSLDKLDLDVFWRDVFRTNGVFDGKRYQELLTQAGHSESAT